ncbi:MAG: 2-C-methyl-D-erythritol 4-phosphate cytidylyltransferase [Crocinitomicaceae bacterium]
MIQRSVIIAAGGIGSRMNATIPKQFLHLADRPMILHTIERFLSFDPEIEIVLALPSSHFNTWDEICKKYGFDQQIHLVSGGEQRYHSVKNALTQASGEIIAVHDAVRPFPSDRLLKEAFEQAEISGAVIPVTQLKDSLRKITDTDSEALNRKLYRTVQTPQVFQSEIIKRAYEQPFSPLFTDEASVVEASGQKLKLIEGDEENIKITTPLDLQWAELIFHLKKEA